MTDNAAPNPFEALMAQTQEMAQEWAKAVNPAMGNLAPGDMDKVFPTMSAEMLEAFFGKQFNPDGLDAKTRLLLTLMGLTVQGATAEPQIRLSVRHAIQAGATQQEIAEAIGMSAMFGGMPAMKKSMDLATQVLAETEE